MANSDFNSLRRLRDYMQLCWAVCFFFLYIPHFVCLFLIKVTDKLKYELIIEDVKINCLSLNIVLGGGIGFLYLMHNNSYFRSLFYFRIGPILSILIGWYRKGNKYFILSKSMSVGGGLLLVHPFSTIINAERIGNHFQCKNCTTIASKRNMDDRPTIGNNVVLGASVTIIGGVHIGDNVIIGAGSVVVKDIPDNCIAAGNPAKIIRIV